MSDEQRELIVEARRRGIAPDDVIRSRDLFPNRDLSRHDLGCHGFGQLPSDREALPLGGRGARYDNNPVEGVFSSGLVEERNVNGIPFSALSREAGLFLPPRPNPGMKDFFEFYPIGATTLPGKNDFSKPLPVNNVFIRKNRVAENLPDFSQNFGVSEEFPGDMVGIKKFDVCPRDKLAGKRRLSCGYSSCDSQYGHGAFCRFPGRLS